ncbi:MAG: M28 family peptidase [Deltaproteobacteria bacterium]|nr:M28 family peptidase [Deltaproteobacteria bacterium]
MTILINTLLIIVALLLVGIALILFPIVRIRRMPSVWRHPPQDHLPELTHNLYHHVDVLSREIGSRSLREPHKLCQAQNYIETFLQKIHFPYVLQSYRVNGKTFSNVIATAPGNNNPPETIVIGAHYDTILNTPGADDNASGVAVLLEMCRALQNNAPDRTVKLVFFTLEEPPVFDTEQMGSWVFATDARARGENIALMISLDMLGYYNDNEKRQQYPLPLMDLFYSDTPNFIVVAGDTPCRHLVASAADHIRRTCDFRVEDLTVPRFFPGIKLSDNLSFWKMGYKAMMITDTGFYRNPNYHTQQDTIETLNFDKLASLCEGLIAMARALGRR